MGNPRQKRVAIAIVLSTLGATAFFVAQGSTNLLAASLLELDRSAALTGPVAARGPSTTPIRERRDDTQILRRNIFDSEQGPLDGVPVEEVAETTEEDELEPLDPNQPPPQCEGSIRLVAAVVNPRRDDWSFAAIVPAAGRAMLYRRGQSVDGREVLAVLANRVILRPASGQPCQITMFEPPDDGSTPRVARPTPARPRVAAARRATRSRSNDDDSISQNELESGISRNSDTNFTIQRSLVDQILENQAELMRTARIIPHEENGRVVGVKMYGIRRSSLLGRLGVQNGDMLRTINGYDMSSPDSALEAYARLRNADHLTLSVVRRGQPMTIDYNIQ